MVNAGMKGYYLSFELINPPDRRMFLFIPDIGNIACAGFSNNFSNLEDINGRFDNNPSKLKEMQGIVESLRRGKRVDSWLYLGEVDIPDYLIKKMTSIRRGYKELGGKFNEVISNIEKLVFEQIKEKDV